MDPALEAAHAACGDRRWGDARRQFAAIAPQALDVDDLEAYGTAAYLTGEDEAGFGLWVQAHQRCVDDGAVHAAARFGVRLAQCLVFKGDLPRSGGWVERTARLLEEAGIDCVEQGFLELALAMQALVGAGDFTAALSRFEQAGKAGKRFGNRELTTLARIGEGRMRIYLGEVAAGVALLDEAVVSIEAGELSVVSTGDAYCTVIDACAELSDVLRCRSWSASMLRWCDGQQELVLYRGHCFIHCAEVLALQGRWADALGEARRACDRLAGPVPSAMAAAVCLEGDLLRLLGDLDAAATAYERANELGHQPQPGLALLLLERGDTRAAEAMIRRALGECDGPVFRSRLLPAAIEVGLAAGDHDAAATGIDELREVAAAIGSAVLAAQAARGLGALLLGDGDAAAALPELRRAFTAFNQLDARHDAARTRLLIAAACAALGDAGAADVDARAAAAALASFREPGEPTTVDDPPNPGLPDGLTHRELDVLLLLASGKTNRVIGQELFISERTVASHVGHIFTKLGVSSRAAATAYAYDRGLA